MEEKKKILVSGVKPTDRPHIGNYFGAMKQFVDLCDKYESYIFIADYHAMNMIQNGKELRQNILDIIFDYLAIGLDPKKVILYKQSDISEHTELCWIFDTITTMPYLARAHAYKDAIAKDKEVNVGTFNYPVLMAADILLYDADIVPVGQDQKQHVEYARDIAQKFNHIFGETFKLPKELIVKENCLVPGIDGRKMSKSYGNHIPLFAEYEEIKKLVMAIKTDSGAGIPENVFAIHKLFRPEAELQKIYESKIGKYKELKEMLIEDMEAFIRPMREKRALIAKDPARAIAILKDGAKKAKVVASAKMSFVRKAIGVGF